MFQGMDPTMLALLMRGNQQQQPQMGQGGQPGLFQAISNAFQGNPTGGLAKTLFGSTGGGAPAPGVGAANVAAGGLPGPWNVGDISNAIKGSEFGGLGGGLLGGLFGGGGGVQNISAPDPERIGAIAGGPYGSISNPAMPQTMPPGTGGPTGVPQTLPTPVAAPPPAVPPVVPPVVPPGTGGPTGPPAQLPGRPNPVQHRQSMGEGMGLLAKMMQGMSQGDKWQMAGANLRGMNPFQAGFQQNAGFGLQPGGFGGIL